MPERGIALYHDRVVNSEALRDRFSALSLKEDEKGDTYPLVRGKGGDKLYLLGAIVGETERRIFESAYPNDVSGSQIARLLADYDGKELELVINCPGGSVYEGSLIYEELKALRKRGVKVKAFVAGIAASAATFAMYAADKDDIEIAEMGLLFLHPPQAFMIGGAGALQLRELAKVMDGIEAQLLDLYKSATGKDLKRELHAQADVGEGFYASPEEAVEMGLVGKLRVTIDKEAVKEDSDSEGDDVKNIRWLDLSLEIVSVPEDEVSEGKSTVEDKPSAFDHIAAQRKRVDEEIALGLYGRV